MPEVVAPNPHFDFLDAIQNVLPHFYVVNQDLVLKQAQQGQIMEFTELLDLFRDAKRVHTARQDKILGGQSAFAATFQGEELDGNQKEEKPAEPEQKAKRQRTAPKCICGEVHWYSQCPYVIPSVRKKDWTMNPEIKAKFDAATDLQKAQMKKAAKNVAENLAKKTSEAANKAADKPKDKEEAQSDESKASFMIASPPASFGASQGSVYPLHKSFLLDSGATQHIVNDRSRFLTYEPASEADIVICGTQEVEIEGYGTAIAYGQGPRGQVDMYLQNAAYIPTFHTNVISFRRMKRAGITWNTSNNKLYRNGSEFCSHRRP
jgi:hypothetical protein